MVCESEECLIKTGSESVWEKRFLGVFFSRVISKNSKRLTYQKLKRNLKFSCLKIYLIGFQEAERLKTLVEYCLIFSILALVIMGVYLVWCAL